MKRKLNNNLSKFIDVPPLRNKLKRGREFLFKLEDSTLKDQLMRCEIGTFDMSKHITPCLLGYLNLHTLNKQGDRRFVEYFQNGGKVYLQKDKTLSGNKRVFFEPKYLIKECLSETLHTDRKKIAGTKIYSDSRGRFSKGGFTKFIEYAYSIFEGETIGHTYHKLWDKFKKMKADPKCNKYKLIEYWETRLQPKMKTDYGRSADVDKMFKEVERDNKKHERVDKELYRLNIVIKNDTEFRSKKEQKELKRLNKKKPVEVEVVTDTTALDNFRKKRNELKDMSGFE